MQIVFFDIDGTIYHIYSGLSEKITETFSNLKKQKILRVLCTDRCRAVLPEEILALAPDGMITSGGSAVCFHGQQLVNQVIGVSTLKELLSQLDALDAMVFLCTEDKVYYDHRIENSEIEADEWLRYARKAAPHGWHQTENLSSIRNVNKLFVKFRSSQDGTALAARLQQSGRFSMELCMDGGRCLTFELRPAGCCKGSAVTALLEALGIECVNSAAFGDGAPDISMFSSVGLSIAVGNAADSVKEAADYVTGHFKTCGVFDACVKLGLFGETAVSPAILDKSALDALLKITDVGVSGILGYEHFLIVEKAKWLEGFLRGHYIPPIQIDWQLSSTCNLRCRWCVGQVTDCRNHFTSLPNTYTVDDVNRIAHEIADLSMHGLKVETVQFSGFTGEPMTNYRLISQAIEILHRKGIRIGIFTNGTLMDEKTWECLTVIESVHVSIDGGPNSWKEIKRPYSSGFSYDLVIKNLQGLCKMRDQKQSPLEINTGYTVTHDNYRELPRVVRDVRDAGAHSICIKQDITGTDFAGTTDDIRNIHQIIHDCVAQYHQDSFHVLVMNDDPTTKSSYWNCRQGCYYRYFFCTIGSDGCIYPCDYQTLQECPHFGSVKDQHLDEMIRQKQDTWDQKVSNSNFQNVCPPLAESINPYLQQVMQIKEQYGEQAVIRAFRTIRQNYQ